MDSRNQNWGSWLGLCLSSTFFTGFIPGLIHPRFHGKGGGLMGSVVAFLPLLYLWGHPELCSTLRLWMITFIFFSVGNIYAVRSGEVFMCRRWGARQRHTGEFTDNDFNETNFDEVVGMLCAALVIWPCRHWATDFYPLLIAFLLFRVFDTLKPWPIKSVERFGERIGNPESIAFSVMADDVVAGLMAGVITLALVWILWIL